MALRIDPNNIPNARHAARTDAPRVDANDFKQFAALRRGAEANDPATLRAVAKQFESLFTKMMLESMRSASMGDPMFGSDQGDMYQDMADDQLAVQLSAGPRAGTRRHAHPPAERRRWQRISGHRAAAGSGAEAATPEQREEFISEPQAACRGRGARARRRSQQPHRAGRARNRVGAFAARRRQSQSVRHQGRRELERRERPGKHPRV